MDKMLEIPPERKRIRAGRLCLLLALTVLLFMMIAWRFGEAADAMRLAALSAAR